MKIKILIIGLILTSLLGFLEWGQSNSMFLFQAEYEVIVRLITNPSSAIHPFTIIPIVGQLILLLTLFQKKPSKWLALTGIGCIGLLLIFILFIGILSLNIQITVSVLPFVILSIYTVVFVRSNNL